jgi:hypothetical protein
LVPELQRILEGQRAWAERRGIRLSESGHTSDLRANLFREPAPETQRELEAGARRPLGDGSKPCDLQLPESSLALVCNAFEAGRDAPGNLAAACSGDARARRMRFCAEVGSEKLPREIDILFDAGDLSHPDRGRPTAALASYTEPYRSARPFREPANRIPSEWLEAKELWEALPACHGLALDLRSTPRRYEHLAVARLLSSGVSLTQRHGYRGFRLVHLWYEIPGRAANAYRRELDRFRHRIGGEIDFRSLTWQQLYAALAACKTTAPDQLEYLRDRYSLA